MRDHTKRPSFRELEAKHAAAQAIADSYANRAAWRPSAEAVQADKQPALGAVSKQDADDWIQWTGGACPLPLGALYDAKLAGGYEDSVRLSVRVTELDLHPHSYWGEKKNLRKVVAYRVAKPRPTVAEAVAKHGKQYVEAVKAEADGWVSFSGFTWPDVLIGSRVEYRVSSTDEIFCVTPRPTHLTSAVTAYRIVG